MAKITDPDSLTYELNTVAAGTANVVIDTAANRIEINTGGSLTDDGVTGQALYSKLKEIWKNEPLAIPYDFPMEAITPEQFEFIKDWELAGTGSINLIRDAGFAYRNSAGTSVAEYIGFDSVFALNNNAQSGGDQVYIELDEPNGTTQNAYITGQANQPIQVYGDGTHGSLDYRNNDLRFFVREQGKDFAFSSVSALNVPQPLTYKKYAFPISNSLDLKIDGVSGLQDTDIATGGFPNAPDIAPFNGMSITSYASAQGRTIGGTSYNFDIIINGNNATAEQIYAFVQYQLRRAADVDADGVASLNGNTADEMLEFIGDTLRTLRDRNNRGIYIDNFDTNDTNRLEFTDNTGAVRTFPFVAAGNLAFNVNLQNDAAAKYWMYFTTNPGGNFGTDNAVLVHGNTGVESGAGGDITFANSNEINSTPLDLSVFAVGDVIHVESSTSNNGYYEVLTSSANQLTVQNFDGTAAALTTESGLATTDVTATIAGDVSGNATIGWDFDYDGNAQGGRTPATDAGVTIVALGLDTGQYVQTTATIGRAVGQNISLVAALERNYSNP